MKAWRVRSHGAPLDALSLDDDVPRPTPAAGAVAIDVTAVGLNWADTLLCKGTYQEKAELPFTPGMEVAGRVAGTGQRVVALTGPPHGGLAERCVAGTDVCWPIPDDLDDVTAAAMPITYGTAWAGLFRRGEVRAGDTVLVHAAAGGTGSAAVQLAAAAGARVLATAGGPAKVEVARSLGADVAWDSRADGFDVVSLVREATGGRGVDVVFDPVGGDLFDASRRVVAFEGRYVVVGFASGRIPDAPANHVMVKNYSVVGLHWGMYRRHAPDVLAEAWSAIVASGVRPLIGAVHPFDEAAAALDDLAAGRTTGKLVVARQTAIGTPSSSAEA